MFRVSTLVLSLAVYSLAAVLPNPSLLKLGKTVDASSLIQFEQFKLDHDKVYESHEHELQRFGVFLDNLQYIAEHNARYAAGKVTFELGVNQFADWTNEEYRAWLGEPIEPEAVEGAIKFEDLNVSDDPPASIDWADQGYVTDVKDQGQCGSCWAFSTTGALEGQWFKEKKELVSLSEKNLVDCSTLKYFNQGCRGGLPSRAMQYIIDNKGIDTEDSYPYQPKQGACEFKEDKIGATMSKVVTIKQGSEEELLKAVGTQGPISIAIDANHMSFQLYKQGVYEEPRCSSYRLDHAVLLTGYGTNTTSNQDYWLVKNSWSKKWGDKGYIRMLRNKGNQCGVATQAVYPVV